LKEEALDRTMWRNRFGGGFGPVVRQNTEWMNVAFGFAWPRITLFHLYHVKLIVPCQVLGLRAV